jgi:hypothetical protein
LSLENLRQKPLVRTATLERRQVFHRVCKIGRYEKIFDKAGVRGVHVVLDKAEWKSLILVKLGRNRGSDSIE